MFKVLPIRVVLASKDNLHSLWLFVIVLTTSKEIWSPQGGFRPLQSDFRPPQSGFWPLQSGFPPPYQALG